MAAACKCTFYKIKIDLTTHIYFLFYSRKYVKYLVHNVFNIQITAVRGATTSFFLFLFCKGGIYPYINIYVINNKCVQ